MAKTKKKPAQPTTRHRYSPPDDPSGPDLSTLLGSTVLIQPLHVKQGVKTRHGDHDTVIVARLVDLDTGKVWPDWHVFGTLLVKQLAGRIGDNVLAVIGQGDPGQPGARPPWLLIDATSDPDACRAADDWIDATEATPATVPQPPTTPSTTTPDVAALLALLGKQTS